MLKNLLRLVPALTGILFVYAGLYKLLFPGEATLSLTSLDVPMGWASFLVATIIVMELYLGFLLLLRTDLKYALSAAMFLMFVFTVYLWYLSTLAHPPSCGCLGLTGIFNSTKHEAFFGVFRNCAILWLLKWSYDYYFKTPNGAEPKQAA